MVPAAPSSRQGSPNAVQVVEAAPGREGERKGDLCSVGLNGRDARLGRHNILLPHCLEQRGLSNGKEKNS